MNIPSNILIGAIEFARNHERSKKWFEARDKSTKMTVKSINSEIVYVSKVKEIIFIRISVDYVELTQDVGRVEDIIIDLTWQLPSNYNLVDVRAVPGV